MRWVNPYDWKAVHKYFMENNKKMTAILMIALLAFNLTMCGNSASGSMSGDGMIDVNITVGSQVLSTKFYNNESAQAIIEEMPFALEMGDYTSQEKVASLNIALPSSSTETPDTINAGEIYLWSGNSLVLFYTTFPNSYSYVPIGYIEDVEGLVQVLGSGNVEVTFTTNN